MCILLIVWWVLGMKGKQRNGKAWKGIKNLRKNFNLKCP